MTHYLVLTDDPDHPGMRFAEQGAGADEVDYLRFGYRLKKPGLDLAEAPHFQFTVPAGGARDWTLTIESIPLMSSRLKETLDDMASDTDSIVWLPATLTEVGGEAMPYWVPYFPEPVAGLNEALTTRGPGGPIRWVLDPYKLQGHRVMAIAEVGNQCIVVRNDVHEQLLQRRVLDGVQVVFARV